MFGATALLAGLLWLARSSQTHRLPQGYVGPVVILFGDPEGGEPQRERLQTLYEIPPNGVLRLRTPAPAPGWYLNKYLYVVRGRAPQEIPEEGDDDELQVFRGLSGSDGEGLLWKAYIVGTPRERNDWFEIQEQAIWEARTTSGKHE